MLDGAPSTHIHDHQGHCHRIFNTFINMKVINATRVIKEIKTIMVTVVIVALCYLNI